MIIAVADTHAVIWYVEADPKLSNNARSVIATASADGNEVAVSAITLVEMIYLAEKGRIPKYWLTPDVVVGGDTVFTIVPVDALTARALSEIDGTQVRDMPDRIIAATALQLDVPLISRDSKIVLPNVQTIW